MDEHKKTILKSVINHTFLLKRLPNKEDPLNVSVRIDLFLLQRLSTAIQHLSETAASSSIKSALQLFQSWHKSQNELSSNPEDFLGLPLGPFKSQLENLQENESACLFLRAQNSVIWFTALTDSQLRVISFRGSLNNKSVMSHGGGLLVTYPETVQIIPKTSFLTSDGLMRELRLLCWETCSVAVEKAHKSGSRPEEVRDPSNPFMITEFVASILNVYPTTEENITKINNKKTKVTVTKKVRDQVNINTGAYIPWRRSGLWMCAKVVLQMSLNETAASESEARHYYKLILLQMLTSLCKDYIQAEGYARWDIIHQMIVKLACRISKIERDFPNRIGQVMKMASMLVDQWQKKLSSDWKHVCESDGAGGRIGTMTPIKLNEEQLEKDFIHEISMLKEHLTKSKDTMKFSCLQTSLPDVTPTELNLSLDQLLSQKPITDNARGDPHLNEETVWIYQVERFARENLIDKNRNFYAVQSIFELLEKYVNFVLPVYGIENCDPVALSRMTLTILRFIQFLDKIAVVRHSLLRKYGCGIGTSIFERLLVSSKREMNLASELKKYFAERNAGKKRSWIAVGRLNSYNFSARYADYHPKLRALKLEILKDIDKEIEMKKDDVVKAKEEYNQLTIEIYIAGNPMTRHMKMRERDQILRSVDWYEKILPTENYQQNAVVFELGIPEELRCLRDSVVLFKEIVGQTLEGSESRVRKAKIVKKWTDYLNTYSNNYRQAEPLPKNLTLGSTSKPWSASHYSKQRRPDVSSASIEEFIQENAMNCIYKIKKFLPEELKWHPLEDMFTFKLSESLQSERYNSLQFAMNVQRFTENYVLANQYNCHKKLRLREWHSFGSMRSGHKIQIRNLYMALSNKELSLETEPVLALILQTIWERGPGLGHNPEIYVDFQDDNFALEFLQLLNKIRIENCSNWSSPLIYLTLTVIGIRILEVNNETSATVMKEAATCIKQIRETLNKWSEKLESLISQKQTDDNSKDDTGDLLVILTQISLCSAFTFNVSSQSHMEYLITTEEHIKYWLQTLYRLNYLVNRERIYSLGKFSSFLKNLLLHARSTIPLQVYEIIQLMRLTFNYKDALHNFVCSIWHRPDFKAILKDKIPTWHFSTDNSKSHVFTSTYPGGHILSVDILRGIFLVDGYPPEHLPEDIIYHPLFKTYFQSNRFRVQLDSTGVFTTVDKYRGAHYKFLKSENTLIIQRVRNNDSLLELIPREMFQDIIPFDLVEKFTHWYDSETGNVKFLRNASNLNDHEYVDYILVATNSTPDCYKFLLRSNHTDASNDPDGEDYFFCITSTSFKKLVEGLTQFENENFIHVVKNNKSNQITIKLWRHDLSFYWKRNDGLLYSNNFRGFHISELDPGKSSLGTLIGLESFLVLKENISSKLLVLVPHGFIEIHSSHDDPDHKFSSHQSVRIMTTSDLRSPSYFSLEVDQVLRRLRPTNEKSTWLYLAALHAATSSPLPDPFTGLTGLEMCMWILQSGMVWSCSPYDPECQQTLQFISTLSPRYNFYPDYLKSMQVIEKWPEGLEKNSYAVYDGYCIAVKKLLDDSSCLEGLFPDSPKSFLLPKTREELVRRSYFRHINLYNEAAHLTENFLETSIKPISLECRCVNSSLGKEVELVRLAKHRNEIRPWLCDKPSSTPTVAQLILTKQPLEVNYQTTPELLLQEGISSWLQSDLRSNWFHLYKIALMPKYQHEFTLLLGTYLYAAVQETKDEKNIDPNQILLLHNISCLSQSKYVSWPDIPKGVYFEPLKHSPDETEIRSILIKYINGFTGKRWNYDTERDYEFAKLAHENEAGREAEKLLKHIMTLWPCSGIPSYEHTNIIMSYKKISVRTALEEINKKLHFWFRNRTLKLFVEKVDSLLKTLTQNFEMYTAPSLTNLKFQPPNLVCPQLKFQIVEHSNNRWSEDTHLMSDKTQNNETLKIARSIFTSGDLLPYLQKHKSTQKQIQDCINLINKISAELKVYITSSKTAEILMAAGIFHRLSPLALIRKHLGKHTKTSKVNDSAATISTFTGALAVLWSHLKSLNRILMFESNPSNNSTELEMERQANSQFGCGTTWKPSDNPEWLLLQLEMDITIRPKQFLVARAMMSASDSAENHVMQLNMGEGKTSVIVPMIVSTISSDPSGGIPRVTVLNSIYTTNLNLLTFAVGGLLNRRIYTVPCRRDLEVQKYIDTIPKIYEECQRLSGVILTLPEYRLSFRLLSYSNFLPEKGQNETGRKIYEIENWLRKNTRDILDEADEIFGVKFQLIYSTGTQQKITEGNMRWRVCQTLLHLLPSIASKLLTRFGPNVLEFSKKQSGNHPDNFPHIRVLGEECKNLFLKLVADSVLKGTVGVCGQVLPEYQPLVKEFLLSSTISKKKHEEFMNLGTISAENRQALLLLSGYLRQGILFEALKKRWRVEYGVNDKSHQQGKGAKFMAVPFRAKDVAADRTEFAHPDMAIVLTQLSYYYSGLTDDQLLECFDLLKKAITAPAAIYNSWIKIIPAEKITQDSIKSLEGVNLQDVEQRTNHVFPLLRRNKLVVDFWLDNVVFPRECKLFPGKLVTNAWDLCYENKAFPTTGFSGTNDTRLLLPAQITQKDIPELISTNQEVEATLERAENSYKRSLTMGVKCEEVLKFLRKDKLRVLLDAGAIMLELKNEQIADLWLTIDESLEGVVYFNDGGQMVIRRRSKSDQSRSRHMNRTREGNDELLTLSPLKYRLDKCAVYLDDHHTRCTDIKLPADYSACVTVGSGMRRDKLIQACMRMRKLGKGQSVKFYLSHEVDIKIRHMLSNFKTNLITVHNILDWTKANSKQFEMDGLYYWAANGKNYAQKLAADMGYEMGKAEGFNGNGKILAECCRDDEVSTVEELYGTYQKPRSLAPVVHEWFSKVRINLEKKMPMETHNKRLQSIEDRIVAKIKDSIGGQLFTTAGMHEEQEKELEFEKEVEAQVERPPSENPNTPKLHSNVKAAVLEPEKVQLHLQLDGITSIGYIFEGTSFWNTVQPADWGTDKIFATCDFVSVLSLATYGLRKYRKQDLFLRPLSYFVSIQELDALGVPIPQSTKILLLSPFEVNLLIDKIRYSKQVKINKYLVTLHMLNGGRWMEDQETFQNNLRLQVPSRNNNNGVQLNTNLMAPLLIAGGNRFFNNLEEQKAFATFLGLLLKPRTKEDENILRQGQSSLTTTGFVIPGIKVASCFRNGTLFKTDPTGMVKDILKYRFSDEPVRESDHVIRMLDGVSFIQNKGHIKPQKFAPRHRALRRDKPAASRNETVRTEKLSVNNGSLKSN